MANKTFSRILRILTGERLEADDPFRLEASLSKLEMFAHFIVLLCGSFVRNRCLARASALSYTTLLAMIPMLAVAVGLSSVFLKDKGEEQIQFFIREFVKRTIPEFKVTEPVTNAPADGVATNLPAWITPTNATAPTLSTDGTSSPPAADVKPQVVDAQESAALAIHQFIQKTSFATLGTAGVLALLLTVILTIASVENTFNDIWGVAQGRAWPARVAIYWTASTLGAVLLAGAALLANGPRLSQTRAWLEAAPFSEFLFASAIPFALICLAFVMLYKLLPNTRINMSAALIGGVVGGACLQGFNELNFLLVSRATGASKIYGGLALVPLFMFGLYVMWVIVLFGAQVAYAFQNRVAYLQEKLVENVNQRGREFVALRLMTCIGQRFHHGDAPPTVQEISLELGVPSRLVQQVMQTLVAARLVVQVSGAQQAYAPARPLEAINCHHILLAMRATIGQEVLTRDEPVRAEVYGEFARIQAAEKEAAASVSMLALVNRAQARLQLAAGAAATAELVADFPASGAESAPAPTPVFPVEESVATETASPPEPQRAAAPLAGSSNQEEICRRDARQHAPGDTPLANTASPGNNAPAEPEPVKPKAEEQTAGSDDDRGFPL